MLREYKRPLPFFGREFQEPVNAYSEQRFYKVDADSKMASGLPTTILAMVVVFHCCLRGCSATACKLT